MIRSKAVPSALEFMLVFIGLLIPIMLLSALYNYVVLRGKFAEIDG